jgi:hypothetical protein
MSDETDTTISDALAAPKSVTADGVTVSAHPLPDQIAAANYLAAKTATTRAGSIGVRLQKLVPPGAD